MHNCSTMPRRFAQGGVVGKPSGNPYQTRLSPEEEREFQNYVKLRPGPAFNPLPNSDYDERGEWRAQKRGLSPDGSWNTEGASLTQDKSDGPHHSDVWKTPFHSTFSNESKYSVSGRDPHWDSKSRLVTPTGAVISDESSEMQNQALRGLRGIKKFAQGGVVSSFRKRMPWEEQEEAPPPFEATDDAPPPMEASEDAPPPLPPQAPNFPAPPPPQAQQAPPPMPRTDAMYQRIDQMQQQKGPGMARQIAGAVLSASPRLRGVASLVSGDAGRERELERLKLAQVAANEEQQGLAQRSQQEVAQRNSETQAKVGQSTINRNEAQRVAAGRTPLHNVAPGQTVLGPDNKPVFTAPNAPARPVSVAPGASLVNPDTGKVTYSAPPRETPERENPNQWIADSHSDDPKVADAAKIKLADYYKREADKVRAGAQARADVGNAQAPPITPGSREFRIAQDLAYGRLTMQQFRSLSAYSRDTNKKLDIYDKATELNPNFNPAQFEMGYKLASNPKVQQQLASMDNVEAGVEDLLKASDAATRSGITALNKFIVPGGIAIGGKKYSNLHAAQIGFADELSGALGFGSATDMSRQMGLDMTNPNLSPENFRSAIETVVVPFIKRKRSTLLGQMGIYGQPGMNPAAGPAPQPNPASGPQKTYKKTATGPGGHKIGSDDGDTWFDLDTGKQIQ